MSDLLPVLYTNPKGEKISTGSYSARETYEFCPAKFDLQRRQGYRERGNRISMQFGKCIEAGVEAFYKNGKKRGKAVEVFSTLWERLKSTKEFPTYTYGAKEGGFDELWKCGKELMELFEVRHARYPIFDDSIFQQNRKKEIFPNTELAGLKNTAYIDIISKVPWDHPSLPKIEQSESRDGLRPLVIDMKTSGALIDEELVGLDPQLREYGWQVQYLDVSFLNFVKNVSGLRNGDWVACLDDGEDYLIYRFDETNAMVFRSYAEKDAFEAGMVSINEATAALDEALKGSRGKAREAIKESQAAQREELSKKSAAQLSLVYSIPVNRLTKAKVQFVAARLTQKDLDDCGIKLGQTTVQMLHSERTGIFPKTGGIRWPNDKCKNCSFRGICANKPELANELLVKEGEEWLEGDID